MWVKYISKLTPNASWFRARDRNALPMLDFYRQLCEEDGCNDFQMEGINNRIVAFAKFRKEQALKMKQPGITRGA